MLRACCRVAALVAGSFGSTSACLPSDTRPPPGQVFVTVTADPELGDGFVTADGWSIGFDESLLSFGDLEPAGDDCNSYAESDYLRVLDLRLPEARRASTLFALGRCDLTFSVRTPSEDALLDPGVSEAAKTLLRTAASDAFVTAQGIGLLVAGHAVQGDRDLSFRWAFRRQLEYSCGAALDVAGDTTTTLEVRIRGATLFAVSAADDAELGFDAFAASDSDADGDVTLEELSQMPATDAEFESLAEQLYLGRVPRLPRLATGTSCSVSEIEDD